jgi:ribonuclease-3
MVERFSLEQYRCTSADVDRWQKALQITLGDPSLLVQALAHPSYVREIGLPEVASNQRLEFLGDAVLEVVISDYLYQTYPDCSEGELTQRRARVVCTDSLLQVAQSLGLEQHILVGSGEEAAGARGSRSILACALEALFGAVYLDRGLDRARDYLLGAMEPVIAGIQHDAQNNFKGVLQELTQSRFRRTPVYRTVRERGPQHDKTFVAEARLGWRRLGRGEGRSKKEAEQAAAQVAVEKLLARE